MLNKRALHREAHIAYVKAYEDKGLIIGGALQNSVDSGCFLFYSSDENSVKVYVENDPHLKKLNHFILNPRDYASTWVRKTKLSARVFNLKKK